MIATDSFSDCPQIIKNSLVQSNSIGLLDATGDIPRSPSKDVLRPQSLLKVSGSARRALLALV